MFLINRISGISGGIPNYQVVLPGAVDNDVPKSIEEYDRLGPGKWPKVVQALPAGLTLQFKELQFVATRVGGDLTGFDRPYDVDAGHPLFVILDSKLGQVGLVDGMAISTESETDPNNYVVDRNPVYLDYVAPPATSP